MLNARFENGRLKPCRTLSEAFGLTPETHIVSFVGAGGKSSLMLALAKEEATEKPVIITTTTRIVPVENYIADKDKALEELRKRRIVTLADPAAHGKLQYPGDDYMEQTISAADLILIEADGSKQLPIKFPAEHEPVIHPKTQKIIIVMGLSALGRPFFDVCQRHQLATEVIGIPEHEPASMKTIEQLLIEGYLKPLSTLNLPLHVALNQADKITTVDVDEADSLQEEADRLEEVELSKEAGRLEEAERLAEVRQLAGYLTKRFSCSVSVHSLDAVDRIPPFVVAV